MSPVGERDVIRMGIPRELLGKFYEKWGIFWLDLGNFDICGWQHWSGDVSAVDLTSSVKRKKRFFVKRSSESIKSTRQPRTQGRSYATLTLLRKFILHGVSLAYDK